MKAERMMSDRPSMKVGRMISDRPSMKADEQETAASREIIKSRGLPL